MLLINGGKFIGDWELDRHHRNPKKRYNIDNISSGVYLSHIKYR